LRLKSGVRAVFVFLLIICVSAAVLEVKVVADADYWVWVADTVTGNYGEAIVGTGDAIYIARGDRFYRYNPSSNSLVELASPPAPDGYAFKTGTALAWDFDDYIYALYGAATGESRRYFYRYSISRDYWEALAETPYDQGEGDAITWVESEGRIYATIGGEQRPTYFLYYDPATNSWSDAPSNPPEGMGDGASLVWTGNDYVYALRGEFYEEDPTYDFWRYSLSQNIWVSMADIPAYPHDGGVGGVGDGGSLLYIGFWLENQSDYIYALSGNQAYPERPPIPDKRFYRYAISSDSWEQLADLPFGIGYYVGCRLAYANGHIYAWQGTPGTWEGGGDDLAFYVFSPAAPDTSPPVIRIISPENRTYSMTSIDLKIWVSEDVDWIGYSLDGQENVTILIVNFTTLEGLWEGSHSIVVYANDTAGNMGRSGTVYFTIHVTTITVDGDPTDWEILGLSPVGTDPPYNIETYHHISSDLLEGWAYNDTENLYLMIKVRGGYSFDWDEVSYNVLIDVDPGNGTGSPSGYDYAITDGHYGSGSLYKWNETLTWEYYKSLIANPGSKGHIEWKIPLDYIGNPKKVRLEFYTWDNYLDETVNSIEAVYIIPELSLYAAALALSALTLLIIILRKKS